MADFDSLDSLIAYVNKNYTPLVAEEILASEAQRLKELILYHIQAWYDAYDPNVYKRTDLWYEALQIGDFYTDENGTFWIYLYFDNNPSEHPSLWGQEDGYVPWLMDVGWHINWGRDYRIPMLSDFDGSHYLEDALREYNRTNMYGFIAVGDYQGISIGG